MDKKRSTVLKVVDTFIAIFVIGVVVILIRKYLDTNSPEAREKAEFYKRLEQGAPGEFQGR